MRKRDLFIAIICLILFAATYAVAQGDSLLKADELLKAGKPEQAIAGLQAALVAKPGDGKIYLALGKAYSQAGEHELAINHFKKAMSLRVPKKDILFELGHSYAMLGYYDEAVVQLRQAVSIAPEDGAAYLELGYCYFKQAKYKEAYANLDKAVKADASFAGRVSLYKGLIQYERKKYDEALTALKAALSAADDCATRVSARNYISAIRSFRRGERDYLIGASLSFVYDDNVITEPSLVTYTKASEKEDAGVVAYVSARYYPVKTNESNLSVGYMYYQKTYQDLSEYDLKDHNAVLDYKVMLDKSTALLLKYDYNYYYLDNDKYFQRNRVRPAIRLGGRKNSYFEINAVANYDDYFSQTGLSARNFGVGIKPVVGLDSGGKFYVSFDLNKEDTRDDNFDYSGQSIFTGFDYPFFCTFRFALDAGYTSRLYEEVNAGAGEKRADKVKTAYFKIINEASDFVSVLLKYDYTFNDSNITFYDYKRNVVTFELRFLY